MIIEMPQWVNILGNFGFPVTITIYLFIRFEKKIDRLESAINSLGLIIKENTKGEL